jgi:hypothetical protein
MTVKGSGKSSSPKRPSGSGSVKRVSRPAVTDSPSKTISGKADVKPRIGGGGRRPIGVVGCVIVLLVLCCIATLLLLWFTGDTLLEGLQNFIPQ